MRNAGGRFATAARAAAVAAAAQRKAGPSSRQRCRSDSPLSHHGIHQHVVAYAAIPVGAVGACGRQGRGLGASVWWAPPPASSGGHIAGAGAPQAAHTSQHARRGDGMCAAAPGTSHLHRRSPTARDQPCCRWPAPAARGMTPRSTRRKADYQAAETRQNLSSSWRHRRAPTCEMRDSTGAAAPEPLQVKEKHHISPRCLLAQPTR